jgi:hypothetical protein
VNGIGGLDFDVTAEYKADPLIPNGSYSGAVAGVKFDNEKFCIVWDIVLQNNGGFASDGESQIDGMRVFYRNWLPKPGDENEYSKSGRATKRQSKINMLKKFADGMKLDMSTPQKIAEALQYQTWVGLDVRVDVSISEYKGEVRNEVGKMVAA